MNSHPRNRIAEFRKALGWRQEDLAKRVKTSQAQINRLERGDRRLTQDWLERLSVALQCRPGDLLPNSGANTGIDVNSQKAVASAKGAPLTFSEREARPRDVPILGYAKAGKDGVFIDNGTVGGFAVRPHSLDGITDAYAVHVYDNSMFPAFKHGKLVYVNPIRPVQPGDDVVIQLTDGQALIKTLVRRTEKFTVFRQYNPADEIRLKTAEISALHYIATTDR